MATVKKSKKKIIIPICIVLVLAIAGGSIFGVARSRKGEEVSLYTIGNDDIVETVSLTGDIVAGTSKEYKVSTSATVKEVFVKVGDKVKKDDILATFDLTELNEEVSSLQVSYSSSVKSYNEAVENQKVAAKNAAALEKEVKRLEREVQRLNKVVEASKASSTTSTSATTKPASNSNSAGSNSSAPVAINEFSEVNSTNYAVTTPTIGGNDTVLDDLAKSIDELNKTLTVITQDLTILTAAVQVIADTVASLSEQLDTEQLTQALITALVESGVAEDIAKQIIASVDLEALVKTFASSDNVQLTSAQVQLLAVQGQYALFDAQADDSIVNAQRTAMNSTKKALDVLKKQQTEMSQGWKAAFDGTITAVDVAPGMQTTLISSGITLENLDSMAIKLSLSEYDLHKVKVGMKAVVTTAYGTYDAEVSSIAPTATGGSSSSILDNVGSMAGISGLSSLTGSGAGVECIVTVDKADENITAGFNADVEIKTGEYDGVTVVPIESIKLEKTGSYVYLYNEEEGTVTKTKIETGAVSDTAYEVKSGLNAGDRIVSAPAADYENDTFKVKVVNK